MNKFDQNAILLVGDGGYKFLLWFTLIGLVSISIFVALVPEMTMVGDDEGECVALMAHDGGRSPCVLSEGGRVYRVVVTIN